MYSMKPVKIHFYLDRIIWSIIDFVLMINNIKIINFPYYTLYFLKILYWII